MTRVSFKMLTVAATISMLPINGKAQSTDMHNAKDMEKGTICTAGCRATNKATELSCKLTTPELHQRKETVLADLKQQILERKTLADGYAFRVSGMDAVLDQLTEFIKTERACHDFFIFTLSVSGDKSEAWLELTGPDGAKGFITAELGL